MKRTCRIIIALCLPLLICGPATAQHQGPYVGAFFGANLLRDTQATDNLGSFGLKFTPAPQGSAVCGWEFEPGNAIGEGRVELEYSRRSNPLDQAKFVEGSVSGGGRLTADSLLMNFFGVYRENGRWWPYLGAGIGAARIKAAALTVTGQQLSDDAAVVIAYQLGAGCEFAMTDRLSLDLGYRYFGTGRPKFDEGNGQVFKMDYISQSVVLGLKVGF